MDNKEEYINNWEKVFEIWQNESWKYLWIDNNDWWIEVKWDKFNFKNIDKNKSVNEISKFIETKLNENKGNYNSYNVLNYIKYTILWYENINDNNALNFINELNEYFENNEVEIFEWNWYDIRSYDEWNQAYINIKMYNSKTPNLVGALNDDAKNKLKIILSKNEIINDDLEWSYIDMDQLNDQIFESQNNYAWSVLEDIKNWDDSTIEEIIKNSKYIKINYDLIHIAWRSWWWLCLWLEYKKEKFEDYIDNIEWIEENNIYKNLCDEYWEDIINKGKEWVNEIIENITKSQKELYNHIMSYKKYCENETIDTAVEEFFEYNWDDIYEMINKKYELMTKNTNWSDKEKRLLTQFLVNLRENQQQSNYIQHFDLNWEVRINIRTWMWMYFWVEPKERLSKLLWENFISWNKTMNSLFEKLWNWDIYQWIQYVINLLKSELNLMPMNIYNDAAREIIYSALKITSSLWIKDIQLHQLLCKNDYRNIIITDIKDEEKWNFDWFEIKYTIKLDDDYKFLCKYNISTYNTFDNLYNDIDKIINLYNVIGKNIANDQHIDIDYLWKSNDELLIIADKLDKIINSTLRTHLVSEHIIWWITRVRWDRGYYITYLEDKIIWSSKNKEIKWNTIKKKFSDCWYKMTEILTAIDSCSEIYLIENLYWWDEDKYIDTPWFYEDEKEDYKSIMDFLQSNMWIKELNRLIEYIENNIDTVIEFMKWLNEFEEKEQQKQYIVLQYPEPSEWVNVYVLAPLNGWSSFDVSLEEWENNYSKITVTE